MVLLAGGSNDSESRPWVCIVLYYIKSHSLHYRQLYLLPVNLSVASWIPSINYLLNSFCVLVHSSKYDSEVVFH